MIALALAIAASLSVAQAIDSTPEPEVETFITSLQLHWGVDLPKRTKDVLKSSAFQLVKKGPVSPTEIDAAVERMRVILREDKKMRTRLEYRLELIGNSFHLYLSVLPDFA